LDIAAGLAAGTYTVELTASNGITPNATLTFTLTINAAPTPTPDPGPDPEPDPTLPSTDVTQGGVSVNGTKYNLVKQADGSWLITVPYGTDLTKIILTFTLPNSGAKITPANGGTHDFSGGKTIKFTVTSADGSKTQTYEIRVTAREYQVVDGTLVISLSNGWTLTATRNMDGTYNFTLTVPLGSSLAKLPSQIYVTIAPESVLSDIALAILDAMGIVLAPYPNDPINRNAANAASEPTSFKITGKAANRAALEALKITQIDYLFAGDVGKSYKQTFNPAITYASIPNKTVDPEPAPGPTPQPTPSPDKGGGGCNTTVGMGALALLAIWGLRRR